MLTAFILAVLPICKLIIHSVRLGQCTDDVVDWGVFFHVNKNIFSLVIYILYILIAYLRTILAIHQL